MNDKSYYDHNRTQYICMGVKPYYYENYYQCSPFDYYYNCPYDPYSRYSIVMPTGPMPPGLFPTIQPRLFPPIQPGPVPPIQPGPVPPIQPGPVPPMPPAPVPPMPPGSAILGSASFQSIERLDNDQALDFNIISNDGIVNQINRIIILLLPHKRYSYNFEIEIDVPQGGVFNVGGELELDGAPLPGSLVITNIEQRPGVSIVDAAGIIDPAPNNRELQLYFKSNIGILDLSMRINIDEIRLH